MVCALWQYIAKRNTSEFPNLFSADAMHILNRIHQYVLATISANTFDITKFNSRDCYMVFICLYVCVCVCVYCACMYVCMYVCVDHVHAYMCAHVAYYGCAIRS